MQSNTPYTAEEFLAAIKSMNGMYELPINETPRIYAGPEEFQARLHDFQLTLADEVSELTDIIEDANHQSEVQILTSLSDLLGDVVVYCFSEAQKYGIPLMEVLSIIMESNKSKLGADGRPIKNEHGKFLKGPNYWKPEPRIQILLEDKLGCPCTQELIEHAENQLSKQTYGHATEDAHEEGEVTFQSVVKSSEAMLHARAQLSTEVPNCSALFAAEALAMLDGNEFNHQLREHLTTSQIEQLAMTLAFNVAGTYRAMGANGIAQAYDSLYSNYSGRGDKLDDFSCYIMWQFLGYDLSWEAITGKLEELKIYAPL